MAVPHHGGSPRILSEFLLEKILIRGVYHGAVLASIEISRGITGTVQSFL